MDTYEVTSSTTSVLEPHVPRTLGAHDLLTALDEHVVTDIMDLLNYAMRTTPTASSAGIINSEAALDEPDFTDILYYVNPPTGQSANVKKFLKKNSIVVEQPASRKKVSADLHHADKEKKILTNGPSGDEQPASRKKVSADHQHANKEEKTDTIVRCGKFLRKNSSDVEQPASRKKVSADPQHANKD